MPGGQFAYICVYHTGQVVLKLKTPYRDGTSHLAMSPLEIMQRLAALAVIARILTYLGLSAQAPPRAPARRFELFHAA